MRLTRPALALALAVCALAPAACTVDPDDADPGEIAGDDPAIDESGGDGKDDSAATLPLRFLPGELFLPSAVIRDEVRKVFRDEASLEATLGIDNPGIDFASEWAVFYTPGMSRTDLLPGFQARIDTVRISSTGLTIMVTTALEQNGDCATRRARPFLLVAVPRPATPPPYTRFYRNDRTRSCGGGLVYHDGVPFTAAQAAAALRAANLATGAQLSGAGITGSQASIIVGGRTWASLAAVAATTNIGPATMTKLRTLGESF